MRRYNKGSGAGINAGVSYLSAGALAFFETCHSLEFRSDGNPHGAFYRLLLT